MEIDGLKFIEETDWENIFSKWKEREGNRREWQKTAIEKGWKNWEEWRSNWVNSIKAKEKKWTRYQIIDPFKSIPNFLVGPSKSWQKAFDKRDQLNKSFATIIQKIDYSNNKKINSLLKDFPQSTEFIGLILPNRKITLIEGHHRATTIAYSLSKKIKLKIQNRPTIALTFFKESEKILIEEMLEKGSAKK